ncbi:pirin family protein [Foetidibacter luteolus]|uniref:pirin family protein n=1 Tax=Foetidibacter luteolus TaxID=2608880 RepID=UPI00129A8944|nr:pirin family protein [Foetidibacter luteolus]
MKIIKASKRRNYGGGPFHIDILYPGAALNTNDTGFLTIGRIDHAFFRPPGVVPMHPHRDDEILSYMRSGAQIHKDTKGHTEHLNASRLMMMNAGAGIEHEEIAEEGVEMLQIFMRPSENGLAPAVQFHQFNQVHSIDQWRLVAGNSAVAPLQLRAQTNIYDIRLSAGSKINIPFSEPEVVNFLYVFNGAIDIGDQLLSKGDSAVLDIQSPGIVAAKESDLLMFQILKGAKYSDTGMFSGNQS